MIDGLNNVIKQLSSFGAGANRATGEAVFATALAVRNTAIASIQERSYGNEVKRKGQGGNYYKHVAAKRGDAPNTDTGVLVGSIAVEHKENSLIAYVGTSIEYGATLEFNAWEWLDPAVNANKKTFQNEMVKAVNREIARAQS